MIINFSVIDGGPKVEIDGLIKYPESVSLECHPVAGWIGLTMDGHYEQIREEGNTINILGQAAPSGVEAIADALRNDIFFLASGADGGGGAAWGDITGTLSTQTDLNTALGLKAPLASPDLTGNPTAPTQTAGNNSTRLANTAFLQAAFVAFLAQSNEFSAKQKITIPADGIILGLGANDTDDIITIAFNASSQTLVQFPSFGETRIKSGLYQKLILHAFGKDIVCDTSVEGGLVLPILTIAQRDAVVAWTNGTVIFTTDVGTGTFQGRANGAWVNLH